MRISREIRKIQLGLAALIGGVGLSGAALADNHEPPPGISDEIAAMVKNMLSLELYVYETVAGDNMKLVMDNLKEHLEYQIELEEKGIMFGAGPLYETDASGPPKVGMIIVRAESMEAAKAIADADPMHSSGARTYTLRRWILNEGAINMTVTFSNKGADVN